MSNKKILYVNWGGLGDHLAFSTLPEIFTNLGYEFYISNTSIFRDPKAYDLIWGCNPYVKGMTSEPPNCGHTENWGVKEPVVFQHDLSTHRNVERIYGVDNNNDYPKIYYTPKKIEEVKDYIIVDLNSVTIREYPVDNIKAHLLQYVGQKILVILTNTYSSLVVDDNFFNELNVEFITTKDIFHYTDLIYSCKKFICVWSGSAVLSPAIKHHFNNDLEIECFKKINDDKCPPNWGTIDKSFSWYANINYIMI
jgi:hypothetical protein